MELDRILKDRSSGQSRIIRMTLDLLEKTNRKSERMEICMKVCEAHKVMVGLRWVLKMIEEGKSVSEIRSAIEEMDGRCSEKLKDIVKDRIVVTLSRSHTVERGLITAKHVVVLESSPGKEGLEMARYLKGRSITVSTFPDSAMGYAVKACDLVVVGADAVFENGFINKVGTFPLALLSKHLAKDFYVVAPSYKFSDDGLEEPSGMTFRDEMLFEFTPSDLVTAFVTERS